MMICFLIVYGHLGIVPAQAQSDTEQCDVVVSQHGSADYETIQDALGEASEDTRVCIRPGVYDMAQFGKTIDFRLSLVGEDSATTILRNGGTLKLIRGFTVRNLTFTAYSRPPFVLVPGPRQVQRGILIDNNVFQHSPSILRDNSKKGSRISDVTITNNRFYNLSSHGGVRAIGFSGEAALTDIVIANNVFYHLRSTNARKYAKAIMVGSNSTRQINKNIDISCNVIDGIIGGTAAPRTGNDHPETHGVMAYGNNITVANNIIKNMNPGRDHEGIYLKTSHSRILNNVVYNGGAVGGGGDITIKDKLSDNNLVSGNRITGSHVGDAIYLTGGVVVKDNYINKPYGRTGIRVYGRSKSVHIINNRVRSQGDSIAVRDAAGGEVAHNAVNGSIDVGALVKKFNNTEIRSDDLSCQNAGLVCTASCALSRLESYDATCPGREVCCAGVSKRVCVGYK